MRTRTFWSSASKAARRNPLRLTYGRVAHHSLTGSTFRRATVLPQLLLPWVTRKLLLDITLAEIDCANRFFNIAKIPVLPASFPDGNTLDVPMRSRNGTQVQPAPEPRYSAQSRSLQMEASCRTVPGAMTASFRCRLQQNAGLGDWRHWSARSGHPRAMA